MLDPVDRQELETALAELRSMPMLNPMSPAIAELKQKVEARITNLLGRHNPVGSNIDTTLKPSDEPRQPITGGFVHERI